MFRQKFFSQFDEHYDPELIFISDMIEDCPSTPLGVNIQLDKQSPVRDIKLLNSYATPPDLSRLHLTIIVPTAKDTASVSLGQRPDPRDLESFWKAVFARCGFKPDDFTNKEHYYWSPEGVPERLLTLRP